MDPSICINEQGLKLQQFKASIDYKDIISFQKLRGLNQNN